MPDDGSGRQSSAARSGSPVRAAVLRLALDPAPRDELVGGDGIGVGRVVAADPDFRMLRGDSRANRFVIIEFDSIAALNNWYNDPAYAELKRIRDESADVRIPMVNGLDR